MVEERAESNAVFLERMVTRMRERRAGITAWAFELDDVERLIGLAAAPGVMSARLRANAAEWRQEAMLWKSKHNFDDCENLATAMETQADAIDRQTDFRAGLLRGAEIAESLFGPNSELPEDDEENRSYRAAAYIGRRIRSATLERHEYKPHRKYPWFCDECGYAKHEKLQHK